MFRIIVENSDRITFITIDIHFYEKNTPNIIILCN